MIKRLIGIQSNSLQNRQAILIFLVPDGWMGPVPLSALDLTTRRPVNALGSCSVGRVLVQTRWKASHYRHILAERHRDSVLPMHESTFPNARRLPSDLRYQLSRTRAPGMRPRCTKTSVGCPRERTIRTYVRASQFFQPLGERCLYGRGSRSVSIIYPRVRGH